VLNSHFNKEDLKKLAGYSPLHPVAVYYDESKQKSIITPLIGSARELITSPEPMLAGNELFPDVAPPASTKSGADRLWVDLKKKHPEWAKPKDGSITIRRMSGEFQGVDVIREQRTNKTIVGWIVHIDFVRSESGGLSAWFRYYSYEVREGDVDVVVKIGKNDELTATVEDVKAVLLEWSKK